MDKFEEHDPRCGRETKGQWWIEPQDIALARAPAFSQHFFAELFKEFPPFATGVVFLRWSVQPSDLYAVFNLSSGGFVVQIDPFLEYIIVWGGGRARGVWRLDGRAVNGCARSCPYLSVVV